MGTGLFDPEVAQELVNAVQQLSRARELAVVMQITRSAARRLTRADGATFILREDGFCHYADEEAISPLWKGKRFPMESCISGWVMRQREAAAIPDIYADPRIPADLYRPTFVKSMIMVPIRREDPIGAIGVYWAETLRPDTGLTAALQTLADSTSVAMENVQHAQGMLQREQALRELTRTLERQVAERTALAEGQARQLQTLTVQLTEAEERERRRIAGLLHDGLQQVLVSAKFHLQAYRGNPASKASLQKVETLLDESLGKSRRLSHELSPAVLQHSGLTACLEWLAERMKERHGLEVRLDAAGTVDPGIGTLKALLFRAVEELLTNVVRHSGSERAAVHLTVREGRLAVTVSDPGQGFDPRVLETGTGKPAGFGLLSLRERIQAVGGALEIESAPGQGSRITLTIPRTEGQAASTGDPAGPPVPPAGPSAGGVRVLFADDHQVMRQGLIAMVAGQPDIRVVGEAANGREALEMARKLQPDVIVMDVSMPGMDGMEATRRIKAELPGIRVIALSMHNDEQLARTMRRTGAEAFLCKTEPSIRLLSAIRGAAPEAG